MNIIFNAIAIDIEANSSVNVNVDFLKNNGYIKNSLVSLFSAKKYNSNDEVALILNFKLNNEYERLFKEFNIKIYYVPFSKYVFPKDYGWSLAFYKLCALEYVINNLEFKNYCMLDTDTISIGSFNNLWIECQRNILLYDIHHSLNIKQAITMNEEYKSLNNETRYLTNYGGEFIAGEKEKLKIFMRRCQFYYDKMINLNFETKHGDEFIIACVASENNIKCYIKNANAYINRYWTSNFYLISTNNIYNPVAVMHLPDEKNRGIISLYKYIKRNKELPSLNRIFKLVNLPTQISSFRKKIKIIKHIVFIKFYNFLNADD